MNKKEIDKKTQETLRLKLIKLREKTKLTQAQFAEKVNCTPAHISQMELGSSAVSIKTLNWFAYCFGMKYKLKLIPIVEEEKEAEA